MKVDVFEEASRREVRQLQEMTAKAELLAATRRARWAVLLGLNPEQDAGTQRWCVEAGDVRGYGSTPEAAIEAFDEAMCSAGTQCKP